MSGSENSNGDKKRTMRAGSPHAALLFLAAVMMVVIGGTGALPYAAATAVFIPMVWFVARLSGQKKLSTTSPWITSLFPTERDGGMSGAFTRLATFAVVGLLVGVVGGIVMLLTG